jgi:short-subunit dehydrogenase
MTIDQSDLPIAIVTGSSNGIGRSYALRLAADGYAVVLIGRDADRLDEVRRDIESDGGKAESLVVDLATADGIATVVDAIGRLPRIDFLVNNAGFGSMGDFVNVAADVHADMIHVHCVAVVRLTHAALGPMIAAGRGNIVNVSSMSAFLIAPGQVTYASTKAMLVSFSESLQAELKSHSIRVQALCPGFTRTAFHDRTAFTTFDRRAISPGLWMTPDAVVSDSLAGLRTRKVVCIPGWKNKCISQLFRLRFFRKLLGGKVRKKPVATD